MYEEETLYLFYVSGFEVWVQEWAPNFLNQGVWIELPPPQLADSQKSWCPKVYYHWSGICFRFPIIGIVKVNRLVYLENLTAFQQVLYQSWYSSHWVYSGSCCIASVCLSVWPRIFATHDTNHWIQVYWHFSIRLPICSGIWFKNLDGVFLFLFLFCLSICWARFPSKHILHTIDHSEILKSGLQELH